MWEKVKAWCYNSVTIAWAYIQIATGFLLLGVTQLGALVTDPGVKEAFGKIGLPAYVDLLIAVLGAVTLLARLRTVTKATDANNNIVDTNAQLSTESN